MSNITISSFNCKGFVPRNYEYISKIFSKSDIVLLQEHWLYDYEFNKFKSVLTNCSYIAKSSMKNDIILSGRIFGGISILWKNSLNFNFECIRTESYRLLAVKVLDTNIKLLLFCVYMPCNLSSNNDEFVEILTEIIGLCSKFDDYDIIVGGDFNCNKFSKDVRYDIFIAFSLI